MRHPIDLLSRSKLLEAEQAAQDEIPAVTARAIAAHTAYVRALDHALHHAHHAIDARLSPDAFAAARAEFDAAVAALEEVGDRLNAIRLNLANPGIK